MNVKKTVETNVGVQVIKCKNCGNTEMTDIASLQTPWDIWPKGCPKCGNGKVDVSLVF